MIRNGPDRGVVEVARRSQQPFGFLHEPLRVSIAAAEQELALDDFRACLDVQPVGEAEESRVFLGSSRSKIFWFTILISPNVAPAPSSSASEEVASVWQTAAGALQWRCRPPRYRRRAERSAPADMNGLRVSGIHPLERSLRHAAPRTA